MKLGFIQATKLGFTKAHGAQNDFLLTWASDAPADGHPEIARAVCARHTGIGADGWMLVAPDSSDDAECDGSIQLYNSDGSKAEISGNGTRCAAAFLIRHGFSGNAIRIRTGAGVKLLRVLQSRDPAYQFEMDMGPPQIVAERFDLPLANGPRDVTLLWVGNPQCAVPAENFDFDWRAMGAEIESHPHFPNRTNVSFFRRTGPHAIEARFYERGAGETMSSGTGATGAAAAAVARGMAQSPLVVQSTAGPIAVRLESSAYVTGPAQIVGEGIAYL